MTLQRPAAFFDAAGLLRSQVVGVLHGAAAVLRGAGVAAQHVGALGLVGHVRQVAKVFGIRPENLRPRRGLLLGLIVRLPALYGKNLKKNFLYDLIKIIPARLTRAKYEELAARDVRIAESYEDEGNGFFRCTVSDAQRPALKESFERAGFSALNFTDSRSRYQFYNLGRLWGDIETLRANGVRLFHPATEPVSAAEVYHFIKGRTFANELAKPPFDYDYRTRHAALFGG